LLLVLADVLVPFLELISPESNTDQDVHASRRRHKSAVQRSVSSDVSNCSALLSKNIMIAFKPRKVGGMVILLICILELPGSDVSWDSDCLDWSTLWFSPVLPHKSWDSIFKLDHDCFFPHSFQLIIHSYPVIQRSIVWARDSIIKQTTNYG
jgi:hypothetical protein